ncbi:MAG TPA: peroxidase family protein [Polyangiales bacterium]|nr:peroxidase family protein [Polyangiales bacterium]
MNRALIDSSIGLSRTRPHPLSTLSDYTSVESLRDKRYFSRHLPAVEPSPALPSAAEAAALFERRGPAKLSDKSTMLFATYAQWFTDGFLLSNLDPKERDRNHSTHELDLSQLYGTSTEATNALRTMRGGRMKSQQYKGEEYAPFLFEGKKRRSGFDALPNPVGVKEDYDPVKRATLFAFGGERSNSTPQTAMLNILMLREHNRVAGELERANPKWQDERLFQTARNIVTAVQLKIVIGEYINHISPFHHRFELDPSVAWKAPWNRPCWFAVEFNMLYRWHSLIPDDIRWGEQTYSLWDWQRDNRPLLETGLAFALEASSVQPAGEIWLGNTAAALLPTELSAIEQGRMNRLASYNDYRVAMSFPRVDRFEQISSSPHIVSELRRLYKHVDNIEFYVGLFAEDPRPNGAVPALLGRMVALDAFSQALVNPLFSEHVYNEKTFTQQGLRWIAATNTLADLVARNVQGGKHLYVTMTRAAAPPKPGTPPAPRRQPEKPRRELAESEALP